MVKNQKTKKEQVWEIIQTIPQASFTKADVEQDVKSLKLPIPMGTISGVISVLYAEGVIKKIGVKDNLFEYVISGKKPKFQKGRTMKSARSVSSEALAHAFVKKYNEMARTIEDFRQRLVAAQAKTKELAVQNAKLKDFVKSGGGKTYTREELGL